MKKIETLFKKDVNNLSVVTTEINPNCVWVFEYGVPTRKLFQFLIGKV